MQAALIALAAKLGASAVEKILTRKLGPATGELVADVIRSIASAAGTTPEQLPTVLRDDPMRVENAILDVESEAPEKLALYAQGLAYQLEIAKQEATGPLWTWAWRPAGMYGLGALWFWNVVFLHILNAAFKIALPPTPFDVLLQLTAAYMALYMGGHTVKDVAGKWLETRK
ncbi:hypothetical protein [Aquimixticola soesokkakensis]|nr:hypothetical protein [Aquimixticola soesokkakensis]